MKTKRYKVTTCSKCGEVGKDEVKRNNIDFYQPNPYSFYFKFDGYDKQYCSKCMFSFLEKNLGTISTETIEE